MARISRGISLVLAAALGMSALTSAAGQVASNAAGMAASATSATATFKPTPIALSAAEIPNKMRGQYAWNGNAAMPESLGSGDVYYRDHFAWGRLEPQPGQYNWQFFEDGLKRAAEKKAKFGFRVVSWCPGCWTRPDFTWTPSWIPKQSGTDIPAWNSATYVTAWERTMKAIGDRYRNDPRLGWVDVGGFGPYGEWYNRAPSARITSANAARIMQAALKNFPNQHVIINAMDPTYTNQALALSPKMGLRTDCLGGYNTGSLLATAGATSAIGSRWKTRPVLSEWCSFGSPVEGEKQVRQYHISQVSSANIRVTYDQMDATNRNAWILAAKNAGYRYSISSVTAPTEISNGVAFRPSITLRNAGSAPTYDTWSVRLQLRNSAGTVVATRETGVDLKTLLPGSKTWSPSLSYTGVPRGTYSLQLKVIDPSGYGSPMRLATQGRNSAGSYPLGNITVR